MIAKVRRWATCAANSSLNMRKIYNLMHPFVPANGDQNSRCAKELKIGAIVADFWFDLSSLSLPEYTSMLYALMPVRSGCVQQKQAPGSGKHLDKSHPNACHKPDINHQELVSTEVITDMPGRRFSIPFWSGSIEIRTAIRCTTLVKLPVALSGFNTLNSEPEAGEICST